MIDTPGFAQSKANEAVASSAPKRPWAKPTIRQLRVTSTRVGSDPGADEDALSNPGQRSRYAPRS